MVDTKLRQFDDAGLTETKIDSEKVFDGRIISVFKDTVTLPGGKTATREVVRHRGATCVVPITDEGEILAVRQYRYAIGQVMLEIPAGKLDPGEPPESCALRELAEETGYTAKDYTFLGKFYPTPGYCSEIIYLYLAENLSYVGQNLDPDEFVEVKKIPLDTLVKMVMDNEVFDAKTVVAILKADKIING